MPITYAFANIGVNVLRGVAASANTMYLRLSTTTPTQSQTNWTEVTQGGYGGYVAQALSTANMNGPSNGSSSSQVEVVFPTPTVGGAVIAAVGLWTSAAGGTMYAYSVLSPTVLIVTGNTVRIPVGTLIMQSS